jgi:glyoxylase-like metal-dependent hydrolase (beta-lactamase superfamily II)
MNLLTPHVYWLSPNAATDRPLIGAVVGSEAALVVDAGNSPAHARLFLDEYASLRLPAPRYLVLTHWHWDHVFGTGTFDLPTLAHSETRRIVTEMAGLDWSDRAIERRVREGSEIAFCRDNIKAELPDRSRLVIRPPEIGFAEQVEVALGGLVCQVIHVGGDHSPDSSVVYVPADRVLFLGDCLSEDLYSGKPSYTTAALFPLLDRLLGLEVDYYLESHSPRPTPRQELVEFEDLIHRIGSEVEKAGPERKAALSAVRACLGGPLNPEQAEIAEAFLAGLNKKT